MAQALLSMQLPKPELMTFDGNAKKWTAFRNNFVTGLANRVQDPAIKLNYLIQHCSGEAKKSIQDCVLLDPVVGYDNAMDILSKRFGSNHLVARSHIEDLTHGPKIPTNDVEALVRFATDLRNAKIVLTQLEFTSDMNSHETMRLLVKRLPYTLGSKWVEKAADILERGREPKFEDLVDFIEVRARVSSTMYGRDHANQNKNNPEKSNNTNTNRNRGNKGVGDKQSSMGSWAKAAACVSNNADELADVNAVTKPNNKNKQGRESGANFKPSKKGAPQVAAQSSRQSNDGGRTSSKKACPKCNSDNNKLLDCRTFERMRLEEKLRVVQEQGLCFRCLGNDHWAKDCKARCSKCNRRHHELIHDESRDNDRVSQPPQGQSNAVSVNAASSSKTWLGIIPVVIHGEGKDIETCALIDSGANVTLVRQDIFNELGVPGEDCSLGMMTVDGFSQQVDRQKATLNVSSVDGQGHVKLDVYTTDTLNIGLNSCRRDLNQWEHLKDIPLPEIKNDDVGLLIGTDTTEMFWTHDERRGACKEPFARKTLWGGS